MDVSARIRQLGGNCSYNRLWIVIEVTMAGRLLEYCCIN